MKYAAVVVFLGLILRLQMSLAQTESMAEPRRPVPHQEFFISDLFLRKMAAGDGSFHFEACDRQAKACKVITRDISTSEIKAEQRQLQKEIHYRFRRNFKMGTVLFSNESLCTQAGIVIAAVPGLAGGAMICLGPQQKIQATELPLNIQALDRLGHELGSTTEIVAKGEDGEVYVSNLDLMIKYLKNRYPIESGRASVVHP